MRVVGPRSTRHVAGLVIMASLAAGAAAPHLVGASHAALNPQPLPARIVRVADPVVQVALNPQPEPPGRHVRPPHLPPGPCTRQA